MLRSIYITPEQGGQMDRVPRVETIKGKGLKNDRYAAGDGYWQTGVKNPRPAKRDVTLISAEAIEGTDFTEEETRRNLVIEGMSPDELNDLVGAYFTISGVVMRGAELCTPCKRPSDLSGKEGFAQQFKNAGGLRAEILTNGELVEGDVLQVVIYEAPQE